MATRKKKVVTRKRQAPVVTKTQPHPDVWKVALELAKGDVRRLQICVDGAVVVRN